MDGVYKLDGYLAGNIKEWALDLSNVPDDLKNKIFVTLEDGSCFIYFEQSANLLEWDEFTITVNYDCSISKGSYTFNIAPQRQNRTYKLDHTLFTGEFNSIKTEIAWRGTNQDPNSGNIKNLIIDDYENNPNWKQNGYKTFQIGNHTLEEVEIRCSISVILYFLAYIIILIVSQMKYQLLKMVIQQENLEHQPKHINLLQKMLVQWCMDNNNLLK